MQIIRKTRWLIVVGALVVLLLLSAATFEGGGDGLVRLTLVNNSGQQAYLWLEGPAFYYFSAADGESKIFTPVAGVYSYRLKSCGATVSGSMDLSGQKRLVIPPCGLRGGAEAKGVHTTDVSTLLKLVKVEFSNTTSGYLYVILRGPSTYVFPINAGVSKSYTIPKGDYEYTLYACGKVRVGNLYAYPGFEKDFVCP